MNEQQFCFIICTNDELFLNECLIYIHELYIPEGFTIDVITIQGADSMTSGYNAAMKSSKAKYKIYMHQDVFILNKYLLYYLLDIFHTDSKIGMIGMVGAAELTEDAIMWNVSRVGHVVNSSTVDRCYEPHILNESLNFYYVNAIDGLLMATCVDIPWREDVFNGWDYYDMSQSMEFRKKGYELAVPKQERPWCLHDDGVVLSLLNYNHYRKKFIEEYKDIYMNL